MDALIDAIRGLAISQTFRDQVGWLWPVCESLHFLALCVLIGAAGLFDLRLLGVLQRIALCYLFAGWLFIFLRTRGLLAALAVLLGGYWALMTFVPVPGIGAGHFDEGKNLANWVDSQFLPGRKWDADHDPEGLLSTLPAIGTCLLGVLAGIFLREGKSSPTAKSGLLAVAGIACIAAGFIPNIPIGIRSGWSAIAVPPI